MGFPREKRRSCYLPLIWWHFTFSPATQNKSRLGLGVTLGTGEERERPAVNPPLGNTQLAGLPPLPQRLPSLPLLRWVVMRGWAGGRPPRSSSIPLPCFPLHWIRLKTLKHLLRHWCLLFVRFQMTYRLCLSFLAPT